MYRWVAAFSISAYGSSNARASHKPFNPLLGETFECIREDKGFRYIAEQVFLGSGSGWEWPSFKLSGQPPPSHLWSTSRRCRLDLEPGHISKIENSEESWKTWHDKVYLTLDKKCRCWEYGANSGGNQWSFSQKGRLVPNILSTRFFAVQILPLSSKLIFDIGAKYFIYKIYSHFHIFNKTDIW